MEGATLTPVTRTFFFFLKKRKKNCFISRTGSMHVYLYKDVGELYIYCSLVTTHFGPSNCGSSSERCDVGRSSKTAGVEKSPGDLSHSGLGNPPRKASLSSLLSRKSVRETSNGRPKVVGTRAVAL